VSLPLDRFHSLLVVAGLIATSAGTAPWAAAQQPAQAGKPGGTVIGKVVDTTGRALPDADVNVLLAGSKAPVGTARTDGKGRFVIQSVPVGGPYDLVARKIGYGPAGWSGVEFNGNDTLPITFRLPPAPTVLPEVVAKGKGAALASRRITAADFNPRKANNGLYVLGRYRPDMLGDPTVCPDLPPQPVWREQEQAQAQAHQTFGTGNTPSRSLNPAPRRWWLDSVYNVRTDPYSPYVLRVYINGIRRDYPGQSPLMVLRYLPSDQIKEMYYADCNDQSVPIDMRYSIFVVLKQPPPDVQKAVLQRLMPRDSLRARRDSLAPRRDSAHKLDTLPRR
jgi:hypothetical protein